MEYIVLGIGAVLAIFMWLIYKKIDRQFLKILLSLILPSLMVSDTYYKPYNRGGTYHSQRKNPIWGHPLAS